MPENYADKKMWFDFISKRNDRRQTKRKASGLTLWAVSGVLAYLFINLVREIPFINSEDRFYNVLLCVTTISNCIFYFLCLVGVVAKKTKHNDNQIRLFSSFKKRIWYIDILGVYFLICVIVLSNIFIISVQHDDIVVRWPYWMTLLILLTSIVEQLYKYIKRRQLVKGMKIPIPRVPEYDHYDTDTVIIISSIVYFVLLLAALVPVVNVLPFIKAESQIRVVEIGIEFVGVIYICIYLLSCVGQNLEESYLENLEARIVLEDMSPKDIRDAYILEFLGEPVRRWVMRVKAELDEEFSVFEINSKKLKQSFHKIEEIDDGHPHEIRGRKKEYCEAMIQSYNKFNNISKDSLAGVRILYDNGAFKDENKMVDDFIDNFTCSVETVKRLRREVCQYCKEIKPAVELDFCSFKKDES